MFVYLVNNAKICNISFIILHSGGCSNVLRRRWELEKQDGSQWARHLHSNRFSSSTYMSVHLETIKLLLLIFYSSNVKLIFFLRSLVIRIYTRYHSEYYFYYKNKSHPLIFSHGLYLAFTLVSSWQQDKQQTSVYLGWSGSKIH